MQSFYLIIYSLVTVVHYTDWYATLWISAKLQTHENRYHWRRLFWS